MLGVRVMLSPRKGTELVNDHITAGAVKVIEVIGVSETSFEDAVAQAVAKASESISGITGVEVVGQTARVKDGRIERYHVDCKLAFPVK